MHIERFQDGGAFVESFGYCRAIRVHDHIYVSGTTSADVGSDSEPKGVYEQTREALDRTLAAVEALAPGGMIVRTRVYLVDADSWPEAGRAHSETFGDAPPANTTLEISRLIGPGLLVEVEADAVAPAVIP
ncbi:MAG: RidA family protein [Actinomycetia bacterium]|nr:RidA family protein [Actinomycetes bacterium]